MLLLDANFVIYSTPNPQLRGVLNGRARIQMMAWKCTFCVFSTIFLHLLLSHLNTTHNSENDFFVYCGIDGCDQRFQKANTFARHVREKHRSYLYSERQDVQTLGDKTGKFPLMIFVVRSGRSQGRSCF